MPTKRRRSKAQKVSQNASLAKFLTDPVVAIAILVFAFVALMYSLTQFLGSR